MSHITINQALSLGQKTLEPITQNYKNEVLWLMQKCLNINSVQLLLNRTTQELSAEEIQKFNQFMKIVSFKKNFCFSTNVKPIFFF